MKTIKRSLLIGLAYGLAVAIVDFALSGNRMAGLRIPLGALNLGRAALMEIGIGVALGVLAIPLVRFVTRPYAPAIAMTLAWIALSRAVAPDPSIVKVWLTAPVAGLMLLAVGYAAAHRFPRAVWAGGVLALASAIALPVVVNRSQSAELNASRTTVPQGEAPTDAPDVVIVVLDTVRAANMSTYG